MGGCEPKIGVPSGEDRKKQSDIAQNSKTAIRLDYNACCELRILKIETPSIL